MAQPLVLIHGMWCHAGALQKLDTLFSARTYNCHRITLPGHEPAAGQAEAVASRSLAEYVAAVRDYIAAQNFTTPPVLVGHSMGGLIAQILATQIEVAALVLLTPAAPAGINGITPGVLRFGLPIFSRWGFWYKPVTLSAARAAHYAANALPAEQQAAIARELVAESGRALSEVAFWWADARHATRADASAVRCPVYVVSAGQDRLTPSSVVRKVAARYQRVTHRHWPERCHWVIDDLDTEDMVQEIDGWLRPHLQKARGPALRVVRSVNG